MTTNLDKMREVAGGQSTGKLLKSLRALDSQPWPRTEDDRIVKALTMSVIMGELGKRHGVDADEIPQGPGYVEKFALAVELVNM